MSDSLKEELEAKLNADLKKDGLKIDVVKLNGSLFDFTRQRRNIVDEVALRLGESIRSTFSDAVVIRRYRDLARDLVMLVLDNEVGARGSVPTIRFNFMKEEHKIFKEALLQIEACHGSYRLGGSEKIIALFDALQGLLHPTVETNKTG
jgi:hypothetical protein